MSITKTALASCLFFTLSLPAAFAQQAEQEKQGQQSKQREYDKLEIKTVDVDKLSDKEAAKSKDENQSKKSADDQEGDDKSKEKQVAVVDPGIFEFTLPKDIDLFRIMVKTNKGGEIRKPEILEGSDMVKLVKSEKIVRVQEERRPRGIVEKEFTFRATGKGRAKIEVWRRRAIGSGTVSIYDVTIK